LVLGLMGYYLSSYLDFLGLQYISAGLERVILFLYPTMTVILSAVFFRQSISKKVISAMVLSYAGIALVFMHDIGSRGSDIIIGASLVFASTLSYSIYLVGAGHAISRIGTLRFTAYAMLVACFASLLQFFLIHPISFLICRFVYMSFRLQWQFFQRSYQYFCCLFLLDVSAQVKLH